MRASWFPAVHRSAALALLTGILAGCTAPGSGSTPAPVSAFVAQGRWQVQDIGGATVVAGAEPTLEFIAADRAAGTTGCNRWSASVRLQDGTLRLERPIVTKRACPPEQMRQEAAFLGLMDQPLRAVVQADGALVLTAPDGRAMRLHPTN